MFRSLCAALLRAVSSSGLLRGDDAKDDGKSMDGTWLAAEAELGGETFPDPVRKSSKLVADGTYTVTVGTKPDKGTVQRDPSQQPMVLNVTGSDGPN